MLPMKRSAARTALVLTLGVLAVTATTAARPAQAEDAFRWVEDEAAGTADLKFGEHPVLRYMFGGKD